MWVFVRGIGKGTTRKQLREFVLKGFKPGWMVFSRAERNQIKRCEILRITDNATKRNEYHGLVKIEPTKSAMLVIRRLHNAQLNGVSVEVRKYHQRSTYRDRRDHFSDQQRENGTERRRQDRRRSDIVSRVLWIGPLIEGVEGFQRMHG